MLNFALDIYGQYQEYIVLIVTISASIFVVSLIFIPFLVSKIPQDYFINPQYHRLEISHFGHLMAVVIRSFFGFLLIVLGFVMLFTPGQGILSVIVGLFLMEFPGKRHIEYRIVKNDATFKILNWMRAKFKKLPLDR